MGGEPEVVLHGEAERAQDGLFERRVHLCLKHGQEGLGRLHMAAPLERRDTVAQGTEHVLSGEGERSRQHTMECNNFVT